MLRLQKLFTLCFRKGNLFRLSVILLSPVTISVLVIVPVLFVLLRIIVPRIIPVVGLLVIVPVTSIIHPSSAVTFPNVAVVECSPEGPGDGIIVQAAPRQGKDVPFFGR